MSGLSTEVVWDAEALAALAPAWWNLWRRAPTATPFQSPAWLIPWWHRFAPGELFTVAAYRSGRLVGLAPFYIEEGAQGRRILPVGISLSDYLDVLLDPDDAEAGQILIETVLGNAAWDAWCLEELRPEAAALRLPAPTGCDETLVEQSACPVLTLEGGQSLMDVLPKTKRRKVNMACNRALRRGAVTVEQADAATVGPILDHLFRLHGSRWESRGEAGVLADDPVRAFQRDAAPALQAEGLLRLYMLRIGEDASYVPDVLPAVVVFGVGLSALVAPLTATVLSSAPGQHAGAASGVNNAVARTAGLLAVALLPALAGLTGDVYLDPVAFADGFRIATLICAGLLVAGGVLAAIGISNDADASDADHSFSCPVDGPHLETVRPAHIQRTP